jgi:hypothetical protein
MQAIKFEGAIEIEKPEGMSDEQCTSVWALKGIDAGGFIFWVQLWQPSYEDIQAINRGEPIVVKILSKNLAPMLLFTVDENGESNHLGV